MQKIYSKQQFMAEIDNRIAAVKSGGIQYLPQLQVVIYHDNGHHELIKFLLKTDKQLERQAEVIGTYLGERFAAIVASYLITGIKEDANWPAGVAVSGATLCGNVYTKIVQPDQTIFELDRGIDFLWHLLNTYQTIVGKTFPNGPQQMITEAEVARNN